MSTAFKSYTEHSMCTHALLKLCILILRMRLSEIVMFCGLAAQERSKINTYICSFVLPIRQKKYGGKKQLNQSQEEKYKRIELCY
jgi:hypothetical protein